MKDDMFENSEPSLEPKKIKKRGSISDNIFIRLAQDGMEVVKNFSKHKTWMEAVVIVQGFVLIWLMIELGQKYEFYNSAVKKPYRYDMHDAKVMHEKQMTSLLDILTKNKIELEEEYFYSYDGAQSVADFIKEIRKYKATPANPKAASKKRQRRRTRRAKPKTKAKAKIFKELDIDDGPQRPLDQRTIDLLIERLEDAAPEPRRSGGG